MTLSRSIKFFLLGFLITSIAIISVSCSDDDKKKSAVSARGRNNTSTTTPTEGCANCSTSTLVATALGESLPGLQDQFQLGLDFFYVNEQRQVTADGVLFINNISPLGQCYFTPGAYQIDPIEGQYGQQLQSQAISGLGLVAVRGSDVIRLRVDYMSLDGDAPANLLDCAGDTYQSAMLGTVIVESVNGYPCSFNGYYKTLNPVGKKNFQCLGY